MPKAPTTRLAGTLLTCLALGATGSVAAADPLETGAQVYEHACSACHGPGPVEAPKYGDREAWAELIAEGQHVITAHGWVGVREMPARGGEPDLTLEAFGRAVAHMARAAGADWADPDRDADLMARIRAETSDRIAAMQAKYREAADGGRGGADVYQAICSHCHGSGVAGAPRFENREDWAELIAEGQHIVTAHGWVGVRAMPTRGGHDDLSIEEFARAVAHMGNSAGADWKDPTGNAVLLGRIRIEEADRRRALGHD